MSHVPDGILAAMENTHRELNELERRLQSVMNDSSDEENALLERPFLTSEPLTTEPLLSEPLTTEPLTSEPPLAACDQCRKLREGSSGNQKSKLDKVLKSVDNQMIAKCSSCSQLSERLEFMNDEMNRICENEVKLKEKLDSLSCDFEMAQQELSIANYRIDSKKKTLHENLDAIENLKSQLLANSADRISALQFELERKVDELQRLSEEHRYLLAVHYSQNSHGTTRLGPLGKETEKFGAEFFDLPHTPKKSLEKDLKAISELKLALSEKQKLLDVKDCKINEKEVSIDKLNKAYDVLNEQLRSYMTQFERLQSVVREYKRREDERFSRGIRNSDIIDLEERFPTPPNDPSAPTEANGETEDPEEFFQELEELSSRLEETRLESMNSSRSLSETPMKKVSFAVASRYRHSPTINRNEMSQGELNRSKLAQIALLEQRAKAFELRAENLHEELEKVKKVLVEATEAREDLSELVKVQEERIGIFMEENMNLKAKLNRSIQDSVDESLKSEDMTRIQEKEQELQSMVADIEVRNGTIQDLARCVSESTRVEHTMSASQLSQNCSEILSGHPNSMANEVQQLTARLNEINRENELLHVQVDKAKTVIETLKKQVVTLETSNPNITTELISLEKSLSDNSQLEYLKHENEMLSEKLNLMQEKFDDSESEIAEKEKQLIKLRQLLETRSDRIKIVEEELDKKEAKISSYIVMIKKMKESKKTEEGQGLKMDEERRKLEVERDKLTEKLKELEKESEAAKEQYDELKAQMDILETDFDNLESELVMERKMKSEVQAELKKANELNSALKIRIESLEKEVASRTVETRNHSWLKWTMESEIANLKDQVKDLESQLKNRNEGPDAEMMNENKYLKECVDETMDRLAETDGENLKLRGALDEASSKIVTLEKDILVKDDRIEELQAKIDEIEELRAQVVHSEDKRRLLEKLVVEKEQYLADLGSQVQTFTERNEVLEEELNTATKNVEVLQSALDSREKELEDINEEIDKEKSQKEQLLEQVKTLGEKVKELQSQGRLSRSVFRTPQKEPLLIDLTTPSAKQTPDTFFSARSFSEAGLIAKRALNLDKVRNESQNKTQVLDQKDEMLIDLSEAESDQISMSTLCFDQMEKSLCEVGPLEPKLANETIVLDRQSAAPSLDSFISGVGTVSTPYQKRPQPGQKLDLDVQLLRDNVESKAVNLMRQIEGLEVECDGLKERCSKLEESNFSYKNLLKGSKEAQTILEGRVIELIQANHGLQGQLSEKIELCNKLTRERDRLIAQLRDDDKLRRQLAKVEEEKQQLTLLVERLRNELNRIAAVNGRLNQQLNEMQANLEDMDSVESELEDYKQALTDVEQEKLALKTEMEEKLSLMATEVTEAKTQYLQSNAELLRLQNMENEFESLSEKYGEMCGENEHLYAEIKELQENLIRLQDIEKDFTELHQRNSVISKELYGLEKLLEDQYVLKQTNSDLQVKCEELCRELDSLKHQAEKSNLLEQELQRIKNYYEEIMEAKSADNSLEKSFGQLDLIDVHNKARLEELHEDVRRAMEAKFQLELDLHQALKCAKDSETKHHKIQNQLSRIVGERNEIVTRLNRVTQKLNEREHECETLKERLGESESPESEVTEVN